MENLEEKQPEESVIPQTKPQRQLLYIILLCFLMFVLGGGLVFAYFTFLKEEKAEPSPTSTPTIPANWETYTDEKYGYSVKYPPTWIVSRISEDPGEKERRVDLLSTPIEVGKDFPIMVSITVYDNPSRLSTTEWVERQAEFVITDDPKRTIAVRTVSVGGMPAVRAVGFPSLYGTMDVFLTKDAYTYVFVLTPYDKIHNEIMLERIELFELILSTFRFLD